jgi:hypothetical protein
MALRHVRLGGPLAVKRATEALVGAVDVARATDEKARAAPSLKRVFAIAGVVWTISLRQPRYSQPCRRGRDSCTS